MTTSPVWHASPFARPAPADIERSLCDALLDVADRWPDDVALIDGTRRCTFAQLAMQVGGLAEQIRAAGTGTAPVATVQPMGPGTVVAWFAAAAANRPLVLLDPQNPPERDIAVAAASGAQILIHDGSFAASADDAAPALIVPDGRCVPLARGAGLGPADPLMIFPTSGSTGEPKLIVHSARTLQARIQASIALMGTGRGDIVLIAGGHGNFGFVHHALTFLLAGGTLCLFDVSRHGLDALARTIRTERVAHMRFTPSLFRVAVRTTPLASALRGLRGLRFSGEALLWSDIALARTLTAPTCRIQNVYGSTESGIFLWTDDRSASPATGAAPIGRIYPLWDYALVDDDGHAAAADDQGQLIVRSAYQALGDWDGSHAAPARFPRDRDVPHRRCYATGDIARSVDGLLTLLDRCDRIVKVNGQRVSLTEVEGELRQMPGCAAAAVFATGATIAAVIVRDPGHPLTQDPRQWLARRLPRHMTPGRIRIVDGLPLLPGGKVDYPQLGRWLADDDTDFPPPGTGPDDDRWIALEEIWAAALGRASAAADYYGDFFDLGGDSLHLLNLQALIERRFGIAIDVDQFIDRATLGNLAAQIGLPSRDAPAGADVTRDGIPHFRLVRAARGPSRGIALVMPGRGGAAVVDPWIAAGTLPGYDLWVCDIAWPQGHMLQHRRWLDAAALIATAILDGRGPRPDILVGFSIAGYIAWLVDRALAAAARPPSALICLDPAPMHRGRRSASLRLRRFIARTARGRRSPMLLIRRSTDGPVRTRDVVRGGWIGADGDISTIGIPTIDHADMNTPPVLRTVAAQMERFASDPASFIVATGQAYPGIDTAGGRLYAMLNAGGPVTRHQIEPIMPSILQTGSLSALNATLYLSIAHGDRTQAERCMAAIAAIAPQSSANRFAARMVAHTGRRGVAPPRRRRSFVMLDTMDAIRHASAIASRSTPCWRSRLRIRWWMVLEYLRLRLHNQRYRATMATVHLTRRFR